MLNSIQSNELNRGSKLKIYLTSKTSIFAIFLPFNKAYQSFLANFQIFETEATKKETESKGITVTKAQLKKRIATKFSFILGKTFEYATEIADETLKAKVNYALYDIIKMKDADILPFVTNLNTTVFTAALFANATFITYNITAAQVAAILADANAFNSKIGEVNVVESTSSTANKNIDTTIDAIHKNITSMDNLIDEFATTNPDFVDGFHSNAALENLGIRHQGIEGVISKNGVPQAGIKVTIVGTNKSAVTDKEGHYSITKVKVGSYNVEVESNSTTPQSKAIKIQSKNIDTIDFNI